jgi:hypothetical protein
MKTVSQALHKAGVMASPVVLCASLLQARSRALEADLLAKVAASSQEAADAAAAAAVADPLLLLPSKGGLAGVAASSGRLAAGSGAGGKVRAWQTHR